MIQAFPGHTRQLTVNLRVDPTYRALADIALQILRGEIDQIDFGTRLQEGASAVILQEPETVSFADPFIQSPGFQMVRRVLRYFRDHQGITDMMDFKFITPTRRMRKVSESHRTIIR